VTDLCAAPQPARPTFVVVTPAHNEEAFIERTIVSMIRQSARPIRWVVVNDGSTDGTRDIIERYARQHPFITLFDIQRDGERSFSSKVRAFNYGLSQCDDLHFDYVGNLDADISLNSDYFSRVLNEFQRDALLGIAGGIVRSRIANAFVTQVTSLDSVAGAVQLFRLRCFQQIGGYKPLPWGGIDAAAEITARMKGWKVRTFPEIAALEHRRTGTATSGPLASRAREGLKYHSLGYGFFFLCLRCLYRLTERPRILGSGATLLGYLYARLRGRPVIVPAEVVSHLRHEQREKLKRSFGALIHREAK
jgi:poly-beta-1,6-N-acetyl-D-glucosamine synthase